MDEESSGDEKPEGRDDDEEADGGRTAPSYRCLVGKEGIYICIYRHRYTYIYIWIYIYIFR